MAVLPVVQEEGAWEHFVKVAFSGTKFQYLGPGVQPEALGTLEQFNLNFFLNTNVFAQSKPLFSISVSSPEMRPYSSYLQGCVWRDFITSKQFLVGSQCKIKTYYFPSVLPFSICPSYSDTSSWLVVISLVWQRDCSHHQSELRLTVLGWSSRLNPH